MEDITLLYNGSDEFPYWQPILAVDLFSYVSFSFGSIFLINIPLLVALCKINKKHLKALNMFHIFLVIAAVVEDILRLAIRIFLMPGVYRFCSCDGVGATAYVIVVAFFIVYQCSMFSCLGVLQLLVIFGKKKVANLKVTFGIIFLSISVGLLFDAAIVRDVYRTRERVFCYDAYCPDHRPEAGISNLIMIFLAFSLGAYLPSIAVVIVTSTWSCVIFKRYYTGGDDQLNRRMLSLPFIMPLANSASSVVEVFSIQIVAEILLKLPLGIYYAHWIAFAQTLVFLLMRFLSRIIYPLVLIYTHTELRRSVNTLLKLFKRNNNRVAPKTPTQSSDQ